jgi:hypothetical protein
MIEDEDRAADDLQPPAANDDGNGAARPRIDAAVLRIARLIGRQMARDPPVHYADKPIPEHPEGSRLGAKRGSRLEAN